MLLRAGGLSDRPPVECSLHPDSVGAGALATTLTERLALSGNARTALLSSTKFLTGSAAENADLSPASKSTLPTRLRGEKGLFRYAPEALPSAYPITSQTSTGLLLLRH